MNIITLFLNSLHFPLHGFRRLRHITQPLCGPSDEERLRQVDQQLQYADKEAGFPSTRKLIAVLRLSCPTGTFLVRGGTRPRIKPISAAPLSHTLRLRASPH
jgi:hypothetical protein